ncbi:replicative DNA helicase [Clostridium cagae]|uniref:replicative DNA helicase n=1 Tax=Clostridium cagae TaxID=2080751 RepID=UPI003F75B7B3
MLVSNQQITLEQEIIGGLFNNNNLITKAKDIIKPNMFSISTHKAIYKAFIDMKVESLEIDLINFLEHYKDKIPTLGGVTYITEIATSSPNEANFESKLKILVENYKRNQIKDIIPVLKEKENLKELVSTLESTLKNIYESEVVNNIDICNEYEKYLGWIYEDNKQTGYKSGLFALDEALGNFQKGRLITLFARSGVGKSTVAIDMAKNMILQKHKIIYASGEMAAHEVLGKMSASKLNIRYSKIINKKLENKEKEIISSFATTLLNNNFHVTNETNINKLINEIKTYKLQYGLDVLFVDYVNKYTNGVEGYSLTEKIGTITSLLKDLALKENICVVLLAQCNRAADKNTGDYMSDKITEADIQDSARIEQDSDQLIALYRNKKLDDQVTRESMFKEGKLDYGSKRADKNPYCINMIICKNRHGKRGTLAFKWNGEYSKVSPF